MWLKEGQKLVPITSGVISMLRVLLYTNVAVMALKFSGDGMKPSRKSSDGCFPCKMQPESNAGAGETVSLHFDNEAGEDFFNAAYFLMYAGETIKGGELFGKIKVVVECLVLEIAVVFPVFVGQLMCGRASLVSDALGGLHPMLLALVLLAALVAALVGWPVVVAAVVAC